MMVLEMGEVAEVRESMIRCLRHFDIELRKPFYLFDEGRVETSVFDADEQIIFVYRFMGRTGDDALRCTVVERFDKN